MVRCAVQVQQFIVVLGLVRFSDRILLGILGSNGSIQFHFPSSQFPLSYGHQPNPHGKAPNYLPVLDPLFLTHPQKTVLP